MNSELRAALIKSQVQSGPEQSTDDKVQPFSPYLAFSSTMEGVCSAQVQSPNEHSREANEVKGMQ